MTHPNTVAFSAGAVCCPDEASARTHCDRATWWQPSRLHETGTNGMVAGPGRMTLTWFPAERRWTR